MGSSKEQFRLRWNDFQTNFTNAFNEIRNEEEFFDVSLVAEGSIISAHKLVLCACSPMFKKMLKTDDHPKPIIYLQGVRFQDISSILNFMYRGEVQINQEDISTFLSTAEELGVRGLCQKDNEDSKDDRDSSGRPSSKTSSEANVNSTRVARSDTPPLKRSRLDDSDFFSHESQHDNSSRIESPLENRSENFRNQSPERPRIPAPLAGTPDFPVPGNDYNRVGHSTMENYRRERLHSQHSQEDSLRDRQDTDEGDIVDSIRERQLGQVGDIYRALLDEIPHNQLSTQPLGGRDSRDPLSTVLVIQSPKGWHCPECVHVSTTKGNLKSHILSGKHKINQERVAVCEFCRKSYSTRQSLQVHISTHHRHERNVLGNYSSGVGGGSASFIDRIHEMMQSEQYRRQADSYQDNQRAEHFSPPRDFVQRGGVSSFDNPDTDESRDGSSVGGRVESYVIPKNEVDFSRQSSSNQFDRN